MGNTTAASLKHHLAEHGALSTGEYMNWCLTGRDGAYYREGSPLGAHGDFVTAPEVSQIFGELVALWAATVWQAMGKPASLVLVELGPGRGTLMQDALRAAKAVPGFLEAAYIHLVESSESLREAQEATLSPLCKLHWHDDIGTVPDAPAIVIANEFFDAMPVEQHVFSGGAWHQRIVTLNDAGEPVFAVGNPERPPAGLLPAVAPREGDILEWRPLLAPLMNEFGRRAILDPFAMLISDYGYERPDYGDTFQAVRNHGYANPLEAPGETDLSAHVNFAELRFAAEDAGLAAWGPLSQGEFLLALGLEQRLRQLLTAAREEQRASLYLGARRLVDPYQMGSLFKMMAVTGLDVPVPPPFDRS
jgi:NADH dehydrogenase [ubiquinone] 1 alpha subcomplex assembly factor 7